MLALMLLYDIVSGINKHNIGINTNKQINHAY